MPSFPAISRSRLLLAAAMLATLTGVAGCGGGSDGGSVVTPVTGSTDTFFSFVSQRVATMLDMEEPFAIDGINATMPETTQPEPVIIN